MRTMGSSTLRDGQRVFHGRRSRLRHGRYTLKGSGSRPPQEPPGEKPHENITTAEDKRHTVPIRKLLHPPIERFSRDRIGDQQDDRDHLAGFATRIEGCFELGW